MLWSLRWKLKLNIVRGKWKCHAMLTLQCVVVTFSQCQMHEIAMQVNREADGRNKMALPITENFTRMKSSMLESTLRKFIVAILRGMKLRLQASGGQRSRILGCQKVTIAAYLIIWLWIFLRMSETLNILHNDVTPVAEPRQRIPFHHRKLQQQ